MFENEGQGEVQQQESSDVTPQETSQQSDAVSSEQTKAASQIVDLDSLEKFKYAGRELTPKELQSMVMMQSDYTRKTQAIAEERKYYENLQYDLAAVKGRPDLAEKFKSVYPEKFHTYLDYVLDKQAMNQNQMPQQQNQKYSMDPEFKSRFDALEADLQERKTAAINAELDAKFKTLSEKYPYADEEAAIARAQSLLDRGEKITDQVWDAIWKTVNQKNEDLFKKKYSEQFNKQKTANLKGKDAAAGGGIPGQAPRQPRTIKEATRMLEQDMQN